MKQALDLSDEEVLATVQAIKSDVLCAYDPDIDAAAIHGEASLAQMLADPRVEHAAGHMAAIHPNVPEQWLNGVIDRALHPAVEGEPDADEQRLVITVWQACGNPYLPEETLRKLYGIADSLAHANGVSRRNLYAKFAGNPSSPNDVLVDLTRVMIASPWDEKTIEVIVELTQNPAVPDSSRAALGVRIADEERNGPLSGARSSRSWADLAAWALRDPAAHSALEHEDLSALIVAAAA